MIAADPSLLLTKGNTLSLGIRFALDIAFYPMKNRETIFLELIAFMPESSSQLMIGEALTQINREAKVIGLRKGMSTEMEAESSIAFF